MRRTSYAPPTRPEQILLLTWETYHDDEWIQEWGRANTDVHAVRIGSVDELFSQPFSGAVEPDILYIETGSLSRFKDAGLIKGLDISRLPNATNVSPSLPWKDFTTIGGETVAIAQLGHAALDVQCRRGHRAEAGKLGDALGGEVQGPGEHVRRLHDHASR